MHFLPAVTFHSCMRSLSPIAELITLPYTTHLILHLIDTFSSLYSDILVVLHSDVSVLKLSTPTGILFPATALAFGATCKHTRALPCLPSTFRAYSAAPFVPFEQDWWRAAPSAMPAIRRHAALVNAIPYMRVQVQRRTAGFAV